MQQVTTYNIVPGQDSALARQKLNFHTDGSISGSIISIFILLLVAAVGFIIMFVVGNKIVGGVVIGIGVFFSFLVYYGSRAQMMDKTLIIDGQESVGMFKSQPSKYAKFCCLSKTHRQFQLADVKSVSQTTVKSSQTSNDSRGYRTTQTIITYRVRFDFVNGQHFQPEIVMKPEEVQQIVQFFRSFNQGRQNVTPQSIPISYPQYYPVGTSETVYSLDAPYSYPAYPPQDPNIQNTQYYPQQPQIYAQQQPFIQQQIYAPPAQQQFVQQPQQQQQFTQQPQQQQFVQQQLQQQFIQQQQQQQFVQQPLQTQLYPYPQQQQQYQYPQQQELAPYSIPIGQDVDQQGINSDYIAGRRISKQQFDPKL